MLELPAPIPGRPGIPPCPFAPFGPMPPGPLSPGPTPLGPNPGIAGKFPGNPGTTGSPSMQSLRYSSETKQLPQCFPKSARTLLLPLPECRERGWRGTGREQRGWVLMRIERMGEESFNTLYSGADGEAQLARVFGNSFSGCMAPWASFMQERTGHGKVPDTVKLCPAQSWWWKKRGRELYLHCCASSRPPAAWTHPHLAPQFNLVGAKES